MVAVIVGEGSSGGAAPCPLCTAAGGRVVFEGTFQQLREADTLTGQALRQQAPVKREVRKPKGKLHFVGGTSTLATMSPPYSGKPTNGLACHGQSPTTS